MNKLYHLFLFSVLTTAVSAQALFYNNGADIYVKDGGFMVIKTSSLYNSGTGVIDNNGTVVVEGNITNDGSITATGDTIRLSGNWENNNNYTGSSSWVEMNGTAQQITGTSVTTFNNLSLLGGNSVKRQTLNAVVSGELRLNDAELATDAHEMLITNGAINAVTRNSGFVSSLGAGKLSRATNSTGSYLFPTGSPSYVNPPSLFRPMSFLPGSAAANTYGAMVVKGNATNDGYNVAVTDNLLCLVNPNFYHRLYQTSGSSAAGLTMYFDPVSDGTWTDEAHWDAPNQWNYLGTSTTGNGLGFSTVTVSGVSDFQPEPFALARKKFTLDAGPDETITLGESVTLNPVHTTLSVASFNWVPNSNISCTNCENPTASPSTTTQYTLTIVDDAGCSVSDSLRVIVNSPQLLIPTAFSPNGDGANDKFRVLNKDIVKLTIQVYNRWGELVFETSDPLDGWDGVYKDTQQPMGVYVWNCQYQLSGQSKTNSAKGNVTLLR